MDIKDLKDVNLLWENIYPYLAEQVEAIYKKRSGNVLEIGPFSGGISIELAGRYPQLEFNIGDERPEMLDFVRGWAGRSGLEERFKFKRTGMDKLDYPADEFDLVILRGAFFFLPYHRNLLAEIDRVLKKGGVAFVGGGYGENAPAQVIEEIADRSRLLNDRLGRRRLNLEEIRSLVAAAGIEARTELVEEGGVWLVIRK